MDKYWHNFAFNFTNTVEQYVKTFRSCEKFHLPTKKLDWSQKRASSKGGHYLYKGEYQPGISIAMHQIMESLDKTDHYPEYAMYRADPAVGEFWSPNPGLHLKATICHEVSHAITAFLDRDVLHDDFFLHYLRKLRGRFVNPYLNFANLQAA